MKEKSKLWVQLMYQGNKDSQLQLHIVVTLKKKKSAQNSISSNDLVRLTVHY